MVDTDSNSAKTPAHPEVGAAAEFAFGLHPLYIVASDFHNPVS
jgi:hypothetical protein